MTMAGALAALGAGAAAGVYFGLTDTFRLSKASMMGIDSETGEEVLPENAFQWLPDTLSDTIETGWESKQVPGMSSALMQWSSNGGRTISFELVMFRTMLPVADQPGALVFRANPDSEENAPYNANIEYMLSWLRSFCYPSFAPGGDFRRVKSPPIAILNIPNLALNEDGSDIIFAVMTECGITYDRLFNSGKARAVRVNISLKQVVNDPSTGTYRFKTQKDFDTARSKFSDQSRYGKPTRTSTIRNPLP